jgi:hypothetical protein
VKDLRVGGGEGVAVAEPQRDLLRRGLRDARDRGERGHEVREGKAAVERDFPRADKGGKLADGLSGPGGDSGYREILARDCLGRGEQVRQAVREAGHRRAERPGQRPQSRAGLRQAAVLGDESVHGDFEGSPGSRHADSRAGGHERADRGVGGKVSGALMSVSVGSHHPAHALRDMDQAFPVRQVGAQDQVIIAARADLQHARGTVKADGAAVHTA